MTLPRLAAIRRAGSRRSLSNEAAAPVGGMAELIDYLGADPATGRGAVLS